MFKLSIVSPARVLYEQDVYSIVVPGIEGYLGVMSNHAPLITSLMPGKIIIKESETHEKTAAVSGGFIEVSDNIATILADAVEFVEEIDVGRAKSAYERAKERINMNDSNIDLVRARAALERAENRLKLAGERPPR